MKRVGTHQYDTRAMLIAIGVIVLLCRTHARAAEQTSGADGAAPVAVVSANTNVESDPPRGFWSRVAEKPWALRLARMWAGKDEADDPTKEEMGPRGDAIMGAMEKGNLFGLFRKGGPVMWPLLTLSILSLGTVLERVGFMILERMRRDQKALQKFLAAVREGRLDDAVGISKKTKFYVVRALGFALSHRERALEEALSLAENREVKRYRRGIAVLDTVITLSPLFGLLGTVTGMMASFSLIGGDLSSPGAITGGIAEALIATAFGLGIAIISLIPFNLINHLMDRATKELHEASSQIQVLLSGRVAERGA